MKDKPQSHGPVRRCQRRKQHSTTFWRTPAGEKIKTDTARNNRKKKERRGIDSSENNILLMDCLVAIILPERKIFSTLKYLSAQHNDFRRSGRHGRRVSARDRVGRYVAASPDWVLSHQISRTKSTYLTHPERMLVVMLFRPFFSARWWTFRWPKRPSCRWKCRPSAARGRRAAVRDPMRVRVR